MVTFRKAYHPNAYLARIRNVKLGLLARTKVLNVLDGRSVDAKTIGEETGMLYEVVMHHLRLLRAEGIVERQQSRPYIWSLTGLGQKRLVPTS